jgi:TIR domain/YARHG domain
VADIFISYASDDRTEAAALAGFLEDAGFKVWWDRRLIPGQEFHSTIERMIKDCKVAIVIWTETSIKSRWVLGEAETAANSDKLLPVRVDILAPSKLPIAFRALHTIPLRDRRELVEAVRAQLNTRRRPKWQIAILRLTRWFRLLRHRITLGRAAAAFIALSVLSYFGFGSFEWLKIHDSMNVDDFKNHLKYFPFGPFASGANVKLVGADEWQRIKSSKKPDDLRDFSQKYPGSMYVAFARLRLERLQSIAAGKYRPLIAGSSTRPLEPKDLLALGCDELWTARNEIFYAVGYCFVTRTAIATFGTSIDCPYQKCRTVQAIDTMINDEILTEIERGNINFIKEKERADHCHIPQVGDACAQAR